MLPESEIAEDLCALPLVRRLAALLDQDPLALRDGDPLPRGWHLLLFNPLTRQSQLGPDGFDPPPPGLGLERPRLMLGGRRTRYLGDIAIGQPVRRTRRLLAATPKQGRSGRLVVVSRRHEIFAGDAAEPAVVEEEDLIYREAAGPAPAPPVPVGLPGSGQPALHSRRLVPDEALVFRYSTVTFNAHRIHYDQPYATVVEGYPGLVVNGGLTALLLLEFRRALAPRPLAEASVRGLKPLFIGRPMTLKMTPGEDGWRLWAEDAAGETAMEMQTR